MQDPDVTGSRCTKDSDCTKGSQVITGNGMNLKLSFATSLHYLSINLKSLILFIIPVHHISVCVGQQEGADQISLPLHTVPKDNRTSLLIQLSLEN